MYSMNLHESMPRQLIIHLLWKWIYFRCDFLLTSRSSLPLLPTRSSVSLWNLPLIWHDITSSISTISTQIRVSRESNDDVQQWSCHETVKMRITAYIATSESSACLMQCPHLGEMPFSRLQRKECSTVVLKLFYVEDPQIDTHQLTDPQLKRYEGDAHKRRLLQL